MAKKDTPSEKQSKGQPFSELLKHLEARGLSVEDVANDAREGASVSVIKNLINESRVSRTLWQYLCDLLDLGRYWDPSIVNVDVAAARYGLQITAASIDNPSTTLLTPLQDLNQLALNRLNSRAKLKLTPDEITRVLGSMDQRHGVFIMTASVLPLIYGVEDKKDGPVTPEAIATADALRAGLTCCCIVPNHSLSEDLQRRIGKDKFTNTEEMRRGYEDFKDWVVTRWLSEKFKKTSGEASSWFTEHFGQIYVPLHSDGQLMHVGNVNSLFVETKEKLEPPMLYSSFRMPGDLAEGSWLPLKAYDLHVRRLARAARVHLKDARRRIRKPKAYPIVSGDFADDATLEFLERAIQLIPSE